MHTQNTSSYLHKMRCGSRELFGVYNTSYNRIHYIWIIYRIYIYDIIYRYVYTWYIYDIYIHDICLLYDAYIRYMRYLLFSCEYYIYISLYTKIYIYLKSSIVLFPLTSRKPLLPVLWTMIFDTFSCLVFLPKRAIIYVSFLWPLLIFSPWGEQTTVIVRNADSYLINARPKGQKGQLFIIRCQLSTVPSFHVHCTIMRKEFSCSQFVLFSNTTDLVFILATYIFGSQS